MLVLRFVAKRFIKALHRQLDRLPRTHAAAFVMRHCLGDDMAGICDKSAISVGNFFVMLNRTLSRSRQTLSEHYG